MKRHAVKKVGRMTPWVCRDGTRTCAAVMSTSHIAFSLAMIVREEMEGLPIPAPPERLPFIAVFLDELNKRLAPVKRAQARKQAKPLKKAKKAKGAR